MGGVDFDGSPISETDEVEHTEEHLTENVTEYHEIWDHEDIPIEHEIVDRSELLHDDRFASSLPRDELRARYQFRGQGIHVDTRYNEYDASGAYINMSPDADLLPERAREYLTNITNPEWRRANLRQAPPTEASGDEEEVDNPTRPETWPNGNPMRATDPISLIQLRMPPIPDPNRVFASLADSPEEMTDVPSVAQLRALWETQAHPTYVCDM